MDPEWSKVDWRFEEADRQRGVDGKRLKGTSCWDDDEFGVDPRFRESKPMVDDRVIGIDRVERLDGRRRMEEDEEEEEEGGS